MIRNVIALVLNDLYIAFKNKTILLILFIPFFVFIALQLVDQPGTVPDNIKIGLVRDYNYAPHILNSVKAASELIEITWLQNEKEGNRLLKEKKLDGVLLGDSQRADNLTLLVLKKGAPRTLVIIESFSALQKATEGGAAHWIADVKAIQASSMQRQTLPIWVLMVVLLIGFIILPAQVAEEKEKKLLLALLQTPMGEGQWLLAKVVTGMILTMTATLFLHLLGRFGVAHLFDYFAFIAAGSFCFSACGVALGFLCGSQASARTLGVVIYLPHLLPAALSDFSQQLTAVAPLLPSYQFYTPINAIFLGDGRLASMPYEWGYLILVGVLALCLSWQLMKKRWLMK